MITPSTVQVLCNKMLLNLGSELAGRVYFSVRDRIVKVRLPGALAIAAVLASPLFSVPVAALELSRGQCEQSLQPRDDTSSAQVPLVLYCCDPSGTRRCPLYTPLPLLAPCVCPYQGGGRACQ